MLDIGCKGNDAAGKPLDDSVGGLPIIEGAIGVDLDYPGYDGATLPFPNESQDAVYSAHSLEFEAALPPNSYRVRDLYEDDRGYRYDDPPDRHGIGGYEIELVVEKIKEPAWKVED